MSSDAAPMSDNPSDSLRRELEAALTKSWLETWVTRKDPNAQQILVGQAEENASQAVSDFWPLIAAGLEAARADERERNAQAIEDAPAGEWVDYGDE